MAQQKSCQAIERITGQQRSSGWLCAQFGLSATSTTIQRASLEYIGQAEAPQAKADAVRGLVAATADMMAYRVELRRDVRNSSHKMLQMKEEIETSVTSLPMPRSALRVNLPEEQVEQIMKEVLALCLPSLA